MPLGQASALPACSQPAPGLQLNQGRGPRLPPAALTDWAATCCAGQAGAEGSGAAAAASSVAPAPAPQLLAFPRHLLQGALEQQQTPGRTITTLPGGKKQLSWAQPQNFDVRLPAEFATGPGQAIIISSTLDICDAAKGDSGWAKDAGDKLRLLACTNPSWPPQLVPVSKKRKEESAAAQSHPNVNKKAVIKKASRRLRTSACCCRPAASLAPGLPCNTVPCGATSPQRLAQSRAWPHPARPATCALQAVRGEGQEVLRDACAYYSASCNHTHPGGQRCGAHKPAQRKHEGSYPAHGPSPTHLQGPASPWRKGQDGSRQG